MSRFVLFSLSILFGMLLIAQEGAIVSPEGEVIDQPAVEQPMVEPTPEPEPEPEPVAEKQDDAPIKLPEQWDGARGKQFGLGFLLGEPTGISFRWFFHETQGIDALAAWGWGWDHHQKIVIHADYLFRFYDLIPIPKGDTALYIGGGVQMGLFDTARYDSYYHTAHDWWFLLALRLPGGIVYQVQSFPLEVLFELAFLFDILPEIAPDFNVGIGLRFCF